MIDGQTGVLFAPDTVDNLAEAIERLEASRLDPMAARARAMEFDVSIFRARWAKLLTDLGLEDVVGFASAEPRSAAPVAVGPGRNGPDAFANDLVEQDRPGRGRSRPGRTGGQPLIRPPRRVTIGRR